MSMVAIFDEHGICLACTDSVLPDMPYKYGCEVPDGSNPNALFFDPVKKLIIGEAVDLQTFLNLPVSVDVGTAVEVAVPKGCVVRVNGIVQQGPTITLDTSEATYILIDLRGEKYGSWQIAVNGWLEARLAAYGGWREQFEIMSDKGFAGWDAHVKAVKARIPKPSPSEGASDGAASDTKVRTPK